MFNSDQNFRGTESNVSNHFFKKKKLHQRFYLSFSHLHLSQVSKKNKNKKKMQKDQPLTGRYLDNIEAVR